MLDPPTGGTCSLQHAIPLHKGASKYGIPPEIIENVYKLLYLESRKMTIGLIQISIHKGSTPTRILKSKHILIAGHPPWKRMRSQES